MDYDEELTLVPEALLASPYRVSSEIPPQVEDFLGRVATVFDAALDGEPDERLGQARVNFLKSALRGIRLNAANNSRADYFNAMGAPTWRRCLSLLRGEATIALEWEGRAARFTVDELIEHYQIWTQIVYYRRTLLRENHVETWANDVLEASDTARRRGNHLLPEDLYDIPDRWRRVERLNYLFRTLTTPMALNMRRARAHAREMDAGRVIQIVEPLFARMRADLARTNLAYAAATEELHALRARVAALEAQRREHEEEEEEEQEDETPLPRRKRGSKGYRK